MYEITTRLCGNEWMYCDGDCEHCHSYKNKTTNYIELQNNWISVKDRLPKQDETVLCYNIKSLKTNNHKMFVGKYLGGSYSDDVYAFLNTDRQMGTGATHWMPLPDPPESEEYSNVI